MTSLDDIAALLRQQNELLQRFMLLATMPTAPPEQSSKSDKARRDEEARKRFERRSKQ